MEDDVKVFGFWIYLMTDLVIFSVLFAAFVVLRHSTFGGPSGKELFSLSLAFEETLILLTSSFTCSLATLSIFQSKKNRVIFWFCITFLLGLSFLYLEISEFSRLIGDGLGPQRSAFLSSYFTLVGTHGLHISIGLLWMSIAIIRILICGLKPLELSQFFRLAYFWHFLDVVWIFIFSIVYLLGKLSPAGEDFKDLDSARQSQIEASRARGLQEKHHSQIGKGDDKDRFGKVAASLKFQNLPKRGI